MQHGPGSSGHPPRPTPPRLLSTIAAFCLGAAALLGCSDDGGSIRRAERSTPAATDEDRVAAEAVVAGVTPGSDTGFDPDAWADAVDTDAVVPVGASLEPVTDTFVPSDDGAEATVDAVMTDADGTTSRYWLFLRKVDGQWLIYGSLPLGEGDR